MAVFDSLAKSAATYLAKGWGKRQVAEKLLTLKKFSDNPQSVFKFRKDTGQYKYSTLFDRVWKSIGGEKVPKGQATETARKGRHLLKTAEEKAVINKKLSEIALARDPKTTNVVKFVNKAKPLTKEELLLLPKELHIEGKIASTLGGDLRKDTAIIKALVSMIRSAKGRETYGFSKADRLIAESVLLPKLLKRSRLLNQINKVDPYLPQLRKTTKEIEHWRSPNTEEGKELRNLISEYIEMIKTKNPSHYYETAASFGHQAGMGANLKHYMETQNAMQAAMAKKLYSDPRYTSKMKLELGPYNMAKDPIEFGLLKAMREGNLSPQGIGEIRRLFDMTGIQSILPSLGGKKMFLGRNDPELQMEFLRRAIRNKKKPFGAVQENLEKILAGDLNIGTLGYKGGGVVDHFQAGGLASLLGKKLLKKLAAKLSEKELKMLMGSLWKGVDPRRSPRYRVWDKNRWGPGYKWPWQKSRIKGPEMKKSHFASLSPGERVELQSKNADELWEYQMKKKLNKPMNEALEYPFLNPDKNSFIVTGPRTGLGRYQLQHYVDPEDVKPIQKYKVYDWWDDVLNKMHKKPKFKYVKDDKGKIILKEVK